MVTTPVLLDFPRSRDDARPVTSIGKLRSNLRTKRALARQSGNQARGGRAGGEGVRLASWFACAKTVRNLTMAGTMMLSAIGRHPWKKPTAAETQKTQHFSTQDLLVRLA